MQPGVQGLLAAGRKKILFQASIKYAKCDQLWNTILYTLAGHHRVLTLSWVYGEDSFFQLFRGGKRSTAGTFHTVVINLSMMCWEQCLCNMFHLFGVKNSDQ